MSSTIDLGAWIRGSSSMFSYNNFDLQSPFFNLSPTALVYLLVRGDKEGLLIFFYQKNELCL